MVWKGLGGVGCIVRYVTGSWLWCCKRPAPPMVCSPWLLLGEQAVNCVTSAANPFLHSTTINSNPVAPKPNSTLSFVSWPCLMFYHRKQIISSHSYREQGRQGVNVHRFYSLMPTSCQWFAMAVPLVYGMNFLYFLISVYSGVEGPPHPHREIWWTPKGYLPHMQRAPNSKLNHFQLKRGQKWNLGFLCRPPVFI